MVVPLKSGMVFSTKEGIRTRGKANILGVT